MQRIAGQHRSRLVKGAVESGFAVTHGIIIHARQIIMNQRIDVDRFDCDPGPDRHRTVNPVKFRRGAQQQRADSLAAANRSIAHCLDQPGAGILWHRQQRIEGSINIACYPGKAIGQQRIDNGGGHGHRLTPCCIVKRLGSGCDPIRPRDNPFNPGLRCIEPGLAVFAQGFPALV